MEIPSDILGGRIELVVKGRKFVKIAVIEVGDYLISGGFEIAEIDQKAYVIEFPSAGKYLDLVVVAVQVLAFPFVSAQLVRRREIAFDHYLVIRRHTEMIHEPGLGL